MALFRSWRGDIPHLLKQPLHVETLPLSTIRTRIRILTENDAPSNPPISLVLARADNGVIGNKGGLPWHISDDLKRFKALTIGKPCIMGRKTWDSLPKKPLPGRSNIVVTRDPAFTAAGAIIVHSFDAALIAARQENPPEIMVIGGAGIFAAALPLALRIHLTEVHATPAGDVRLPAFSPEKWRETGRETPASSHSFVTLQRRSD
jgi:dihydrofolate reductase